MLQPDYISAMGLLEHLNAAEVKDIFNDDSKFEALLKDVKQVKEWETEKEMLIASNRSLAEFNLSKEPEIEALKAEVQEKSENGEQICNRIRQLLNEYKSKSSGISPDTTLALLQAAAAETEESSDDIAQQFLDGKMDVDKFLEEFQPVRIQMHLRKLKIEKMSELLRNGVNSNHGNGPNRPNLPYPSFGPTPLPRLPYPSGALNMPMPGMFGNHF